MCLCHSVCGNYLHVSVSPCMWELSACVCVTLYVGTICMCLCHSVCGNYLHVSVSPCMWELSACVCVTLYVGTICMCLCHSVCGNYLHVSVSERMIELCFCDTYSYAQRQCMDVFIVSMDMQILMYPTGWIVIYV